MNPVTKTQHKRAATAFQRSTVEHWPVCPGNCYDNAAMESFWSSLQRELVQFATRAEARAAIFEWIEIFYNRERCHSALGYQSPVDLETQLN